MKRLCILGSTGSIGLQAIEVVRRHRDKLSITALSAYSNVEKLKSQIKEFRPEIVSVWSEKSAKELKSWIIKNGIRAEVIPGLEGLIRAASDNKADMVLSAVVGSVGIRPLIEAIRCGKDIALANKEALVVAGGLVMQEAAKWNVRILPVDSEHSAIFQCLKNEDPGSVKRIILTASGGPFYKSAKKHSRISVEDALAHPTWEMGPKITIDSATLMNKGLEAIEAHHLFGVPMKKIGIIIHPQSIVHSMVEFLDSSVIAQLSIPNMRLPIQYALLYPARMKSPVRALDLARAGRLDFAEPDFKKFPCLELALEAGSEGGTVPAVMNAANEIAVKLFLDRKLSFSKIPAIISKTMKLHKKIARPALNDILYADVWARKKAVEASGQ
ncbi:MAG: 1-deoxy-D-xylulose-5-phosphate reductoisomerase [Elusimicrobiota bacterium]